MTKTQPDRTNLWLNKSTAWTFTDDELIEASIRQRVRYLENNLFDEYWDELLTYKQQIGAIRETYESSRYYDHKDSHHR
ncbi:MAG: hypothetical protein QNJ41_28555 [Xenococcaceae cyanobacterium MO_188.B32]|nr:hypothetical protein [Xenococcaceae cyanobacterium MO_188.B32]